MSQLVLSLFPGIDLLSKGFEEVGLCVVRGPDLIFGGDIELFHPPRGTFWGVIGGPPCQEFSGLRRLTPTGYGLKMLEQFERVVLEASPEWWLMENVARVPDLTKLPSAGYVTQRFDINLGWYCDVARLRHIQFGSKSGRLLDIARRPQRGRVPTALANDSRGFKEVCRLQGLPEDFDIPPFKVSEKIRAVGNGVPLELSRLLAHAITDTYCDRSIQGIGAARRCLCGCGRQVTGKAKYYDYCCRKRAQRKRDLAAKSRL